MTIAITIYVFSHLTIALLLFIIILLDYVKSIFQNKHRSAYCAG